MENESLTYFAFARTALKYGLNALQNQEWIRILVPDFICEAVWHPIRQAGFKAIPFPLTDALTPDWGVLEHSVAGTSAGALLMVHYFGQPQDIARYRKFCEKHNLRLVEDNAQGHSGRLNDKLLGTFGDIGISSPRKILNISSGGVLYCRGDDNVHIKDPAALPVFPARRVANMLRRGLSYFPKMKARLRGLVNIQRNWSDPGAFSEGRITDYQIDKASWRRVCSVDWQGIAETRRARWDAWTAFAHRAGLKPVFSNAHPESCPWALPVYAHDLLERNQWLRWGARHGIAVFPWPSLPKEIIDQASSALTRWKRFLCFLLEENPPISP